MLRLLFALMISFLLFVSPSLAISKPLLTVYSYDSFMSQWGPGEKIKADFEKKYNCTVNIISGNDGASIVNRLRLEGSKTKADVIVGLDTNLVSSAKKFKVIQPHQIKKPDNLAVDWWDEDFVPYDYGNFAFIYNQEKVATPPHSFEELLNNEHNWKIVYQDPRTSIVGMGLLLWLNNIYGEKTNEAWKKLAKHTLTVTKGWSESYELFLHNEADFVLSYSTSPAVHIMNDNDSRYKAAIFDEGHYEQIEVAGITKYSKQPDLAKKFIRFLLTPEVQLHFVEKNIMYPAITIELPPAFHTLNQVKKSLSFSADDVLAHKKQWTKEWQEAVSQ